MYLQFVEWRESSDLSEPISILFQLAGLHYAALRSSWSESNSGARQFHLLNISLFKQSLVNRGPLDRGATSGVNNKPQPCGTALDHSLTLAEQVITEHHREKELYNIIAYFV